MVTSLMIARRLRPYPSRGSWRWLDSESASNVRNSRDPNVLNGARTGATANRSDGPPAASRRLGQAARWAWLGTRR